MCRKSRHAYTLIGRWPAFVGPLFLCFSVSLGCAEGVDVGPASVGNHAAGGTSGGGGADTTGSGTSGSSVGGSSMPVGSSEDAAAGAGGSGGSLLADDGGSGGSPETDGASANDEGGLFADSGSGIDGSDGGAAGGGGAAGSDGGPTDGCPNESRQDRARDLRMRGARVVRRAEERARSSLPLLGNRHAGDRFGRHRPREDRQHYPLGIGNRGARRRHVRSVRRPSQRSRSHPGQCHLRSVDHLARRQRLAAHFRFRRRADADRERAGHRSKLLVLEPHPRRSQHALRLPKGRLDGDHRQLGEVAAYRYDATWPWSPTTKTTSLPSI